MTTVSPPTPSLTNIEAADAAIQLFDFLRLAPKGWPLFEKLYGQPFDIMQFTPNDYKYIPEKKYSVDEGWELNLGQGWEIKVCQYKSYLRHTHPTMKEYRAVFKYDGAWCGNHTFMLDNGHIAMVPQAMIPDFPESTWNRIFDQIKRRAAITLREHKKYLARPAFYDTLESELNIKLRKKK
jgi:hypothetical protein